MNSEIELLKAEREDQLRLRTMAEVSIKQWGEKLAKVNPDILKDVELPAEITLQGFLPELYKENPNEEIFNQQQAKMHETFAKINAIADEHNKRGLELRRQAREIIAADRK